MTDHHKRQYTRIYFPKNASLHFREKEYRNCQIKDLSLKGLFVLGDFQEDREEPCQVFFKLGLNIFNETFQAHARVTRRDSQGLAIEFRSMTVNNYTSLQTSLLYKAVDPYSISLEFPPQCPFKLIEDEQVSTGSNKSATRS